MPTEAQPETKSDGPFSTAEDSTEPEHTVADSFRVVLDRIAELRTYAAYYIGVQLDRLKLTIRQIVLLAVLGVIALLIAAGAAVTAVVLLLQGIAGGLAVLCGNRPWLGDLLCGVLVLGIIVIGLWVGLKNVTRTSRNATVAKYEREQTRQRSDLGIDVEQRAAESKSV
jgi:hypothetical protein